VSEDSFTGTATEGTVGYWSDQLAGLAVPTAGRVRTGPVQVHHVPLGDELAALLRECRSPLTALVAGAHAVVARYSGQALVAARVTAARGGEGILELDVDGTRPGAELLDAVGGTPLAPTRRGRGEPDLVLRLADATTLSVEYGPALFPASAVRRFGSHVVTVLRGLLAEPGSAVDSPSLRTDDDVGPTYNDTAVVYPSDLSVPQLFAEHVRRAPDAVAVDFDGLPLTYRQLDARANQVAHHLVAKGVVAESRVALLMDRSAYAVVAMLGVLKAGAAYVPLHTSYPPDRVRWMLQDTGAVLLLTERSLAEATRFAGIPTVVLDDDLSLAKRPLRALDTVVDPEQMAYVMYTSGSTGTPKGVAVSHRNVVSLACDRTWPTGTDDRVLFHSSQAFDASTLELWPALLHGGSVVVAPEELTPSLLRHLVATRGVTGVWLTAALFSLFAEEQPGCFDGLRDVLTGGDAVSAAAVARVLDLCPDVVVWNVYGPTETTVYATLQHLSADVVRSGSAPIGLPTDNMRAHVLDSALRPVPPGVLGELYIAGDGLARGYVGRPDLTAERFVADPFSRGGRLYRTGDLVRQREDGPIEFVGRVDDQVKIRGFRVELGEIEATLLGYPGVSGAAAKVHTDSAGTKRVVGYTATTSGLPVDEPALRRFLADRLPEHMVCSALVHVDRMPLTSNGKIDRNVLPLPVLDRDGTDYVAPVSTVEQVLAQLWTDVLDVEPVGLRDNFFALGGDSILYLKVVSRARERGIRLAGHDIFNRPTIAELAAVAGTPADEPHQRAVVVERSGPAGTALTPTQNGMLYDCLVSQDDGLYLVQFDLVLDGVTDPVALGAAWQQVHDRLPMLRTGVRWENVAEPVHDVREAVTVPVTQHDWSGRTGRECAEALRELLAADRATGMDLTRAPLSRVAVIRLTATSVRVVWSVHHLLIDGWSGAEVIREVLAAYDGRHGGAVTRSLPRKDFRDYVDWLGRQDEEAARDHWRDVLSGFTAPSRLPVDREAEQGYRPTASNAVRADLPEGLSGRLATCARDNGLTLNTLLQGAWAILLSRYAGVSDVCFGATVSGRTVALPGADTIIGPLINTLPVRVAVNGHRRVLPWLRDLQVAQGRAREFEFVPLSAIRACGDVPAGVDLFDSVVVFENFPFDRSPGTEHGVTVRDFTAGVDTNHALGLVVFPSERLCLELHYDPHLFQAGTVERMTGHLTVLLDAIAEQKDRRLGELPMLTDEEFRTITHDWNDTASARPAARPLHEVIAQRALRAPDAVAVLDGTARITYGDLVGRANRIAHHLRTRGVGPDVLVGVAVHRGIDAVVAILAVLTAGGAYVPLDPGYPAQRLRGMVAETRPPVVLTQESLLGSLPEGDATPVCLDRDLFDGYPATAPVTGVGPDDLAYVVYTSGSTGRPKGAMVEHRSLHNIVTTVCEEYRLTPDSRVLQFCSMSFDAGVQDLFTTLASGATLVVAGPDALTDSGALARQLRADAITVVALPPPVLATVDPTGLPDLDVVATGGSVLAPEVATAWSREHRLVNNYGPNEATITVTLFTVDPAADYHSVPLGPAVPHSRLYVLDAHLSPLPVGVVGELYIGGDVLARGYVGRPALSAERFVADRFGPPGARVYRTGDLVRWTPLGMLEFVGRADDQVKVRGYRIEPAEIRTVLLRHRLVTDAVVVARKDAAGGVRLVAYVVPAEGAAVPSGELRAHLAAALPEYMVPSSFVSLHAFPLNPNGKVDRAALPAPVRDDDGDTAYVAPRTPTEAALARIWSEILGLARIGVDDDFFGLGGDSIASLRLTSRMRQAFGVDLSPRDLFDATTIAAIALVLQDRILAKVEQADGRTAVGQR
jgi:amino acid adenylation domain-containing protein